MWKGLPEAKFSFRMRNIFDMSAWKNKTTFRLRSKGELLGITEMQLKSEVQAIGYDLSKIEGYDEDKIVPMHKWKITTHFLLQFMSTADFQKMHDKITYGGFTNALTKKRRKKLRRGARGEFENLTLKDLSCLTRLHADEDI